MDDRMKGMMDALGKERTVADSMSSGGKSNFYRPLPMEDGGTHDNRIIVLLWKPAIVCPELFSEFYEPGQWDFKAAVKGHWVTEDGASGFVYCKPGTAEYYEKWLGKKFDHGHCDHCAREKSGLRYLFEVFDFEKLVGERNLDQGEERPSIQLFNAPQTVYNQLWSKLKVGIEFWNTKVTRITKDTRKGNRFAEYTVEVEGYDPEEMKDPRIREYLDKEENLLNPVPELVRIPGMPMNRGGARNTNSSSPPPAGSQGSAPVKGKVRW